jgi:RNA-binding protein
MGHALTPVVQLGKGGLSGALLEAVDQALTDHELIKVKLLDTFELDRHDAAAQLAEKTKSEVAQVLGKTILLYRADPEDPRIEL